MSYPGKLTTIPTTPHCHPFTGVKKVCLHFFFMYIVDIAISIYLSIYVSIYLNLFVVVKEIIPNKISKGLLYIIKMATVNT